MKDNGDIENINVIEWAFEKGFNLATEDIKQGIHISFGEIKKQFLQELNEYVKREQPSSVK